MTKLAAGFIVGLGGAVFVVLMVLLGRWVQRHLLRQGEPDTSMSFMVAVAAIIVAAYAAFLIFGTSHS